MLMAAPRKFCTHQAANFSFEEGASSSEEDTDSSVPLDYNQTKCYHQGQAPLRLQVGNIAVSSVMTQLQGKMKS